MKTFLTTLWFLGFVGHIGYYWYDIRKNPTPYMQRLTYLGKAGLTIMVVITSAVWPIVQLARYIYRDK